MVQTFLLSFLSCFSLFSLLDICLILAKPFCIVLFFARWNFPKIGNINSIILILTKLQNIYEEALIETSCSFWLIFLVFCSPGSHYICNLILSSQGVCMEWETFSNFIFLFHQVLKFLMEKNSINALHGQVTVGTLILQVPNTFSL